MIEVAEHKRDSATSLDIDDAFSDGEDIASYTFDPNTIREDLAKGIVQAQLSAENSIATPEHSISALSIVAPRSPSPEQPPSPSATDEFDDSSRFSEITLSRSNSQSSVADRDVEINIEAPEDDEEYSDSSEINDPQALTDTFKRPGHHVTPSQESNATTVPHSVDNTPSTSSIALPSLPDEPSTPIALPVSNAIAAASIALPTSPISAKSLSIPEEASTITHQGLTEPSKQPGHKYSRSTGPSTFEKYMSKTRPVFLPPKTKQEDNKHLADWETMMKQSRQAGMSIYANRIGLLSNTLLAEKRRKAFAERRIAREKGIEDSINLWQKEIIPDWRIVHRKPHLRKLWWQGIPGKLRANLWESAVGNPLALSKGKFNQHKWYCLHSLMY